MTEYRISRYSMRDKAAVARLQTHLWGGDQALNTAYFEWKYERNPYIGEPLVYLAHHRDEVVGMRGVFGTRWELPARAGFITFPYADDLVVHPAHRGRGLHRMIMSEALPDLARRGFDYVLNLSASPVTAFASLNMAWRDGGSFEPLCRRTRRKVVADKLGATVQRLPLVWRHSDRLARALMPSRLQLFDRPGRAHSIAANAPRVQISNETLAGMADLVARIPSPSGIRHVRDEQFLRWRYANPLSEYRCITRGAERINGYIVLQRSLGSNADPMRVNIVDWEAIDEPTRLLLLDDVLANRDLHELWCWGIALPPEIERTLRHRGFTGGAANNGDERGHKRQTSLIIRALDDARRKDEWSLRGKRLDDVRSWDLRMIYSMAC